MFTTLHSIAVVPAALSYCHVILRNSVNRLHCAEVYYTAQFHGSSGGAALLLRGTVQFRKQGFIAVILLTLRCITMSGVFAQLEKGLLY